VGTKEDIEKFLLNTRQGSVDAIILVPSNLLRNHIGVFVDKAKIDKLPLSVYEESLVQQGALVSYGDDFPLIGVQTARIVAKVLNGSKPSEIPIETPEHQILAVNRTTAKIIGLKIPREFLERVDHILD
jgi:putative ABC transport system substrate-binding protein